MSRAVPQPAALPDRQGQIGLGNLSLDLGGGLGIRHLGNNRMRGICSLRLAVVMAATCQVDRHQTVKMRQIAAVLLQQFANLRRPLDGGPLVWR